MRAEENQSFTDFVSAEQAGLLRLAILLAGDRGQAEDLVQTALMKSYRHWARITRSGTPSAYVRRVLVTTHTSWRRRLSSTEQVMETLPDRADPPGMPDERGRGAAPRAARAAAADADRASCCASTRTCPSSGPPS